MTDNYVVKLNFRNVCSVLLCCMFKAQHTHYSHGCTKPRSVAFL